MTRDEFNRLHERLAQCSRMKFLMGRAWMEPHHAERRYGEQHWARELRMLSDELDRINSILGADPDAAAFLAEIEDDQIDTDNLPDEAPGNG